MTYRSSQWESPPARLTIRGRTIKFGGYPSQGADTDGDQDRAGDVVKRALAEN